MSCRSYAASMRSVLDFGLLPDLKKSVLCTKYATDGPCTHYSSFSLTAPALASTCSRADRPVSGRPWTAASPPTAEKALWKTHSTAASTGSSNMKGSAGTAARPNYHFVSDRLNSVREGTGTYADGTPCAQLYVLIVFQSSTSVLDD
jgi:hypothetical protein